jgi:hypothetical protein
MPTQYLKAERLPAWNTYAVMKLDHAASGRSGGDGVLDRDELAQHARELGREIDRLEGRRHLSTRDREWLGEAQAQRRAALELLGDLEAADAQGLVYLPDELLTASLPESDDDALVDVDALDIGALATRIPENLRRRAAEILMLDDEHRFGRLTRDVLHHARARYEHMDPRVAMNMVRSKETALQEIDDLARLLGHAEVARA